MTNFEYILNNITPDEYAKNTTHSIEIVDWEDEDIVYENLLGHRFYLEEDAVEDMVDWLNLSRDG